MFGNTYEIDDLLYTVKDERDWIAGDGKEEYENPDAPDEDNIECVAYEIWCRDKLIEFINSKPEGSRAIEVLREFEAKMNDMYNSLEPDFPNRHVYMYARNIAYGLENEIIWGA